MNTNLELCVRLLATKFDSFSAHGKLFADKISKKLIYDPRAKMIVSQKGSAKFSATKEKTSCTMS